MLLFSKMQTEIGINRCPKHELDNDREIAPNAIAKLKSYISFHLLRLYLDT